MELHLQSIQNYCCVCGEQLIERKFECIHFKAEISSIWGQNVSLDSYNVHPSYICGKCRSVCSNAGINLKLEHPPLATPGHLTFSIFGVQIPLPNFKCPISMDKC